MKSKRTKGASENAGWGFRSPLKKALFFFGAVLFNLLVLGGFLFISLFFLSLIFRDVYLGRWAGVLVFVFFALGLAVSWVIYKKCLGRLSGKRWFLSLFDISAENENV